MYLLMNFVLFMYDMYALQMYATTDVVSSIS